MNNTTHERERARLAKISRDRSTEGRNVEIRRAPKNPRRKNAARKSFRIFCERYLPHRFALGWSDDHLRVIGKIEAAVLRGGQFAFAMPRRSGKTTLCEAAALWAMLYGHRRCVLFIGADLTGAVDSFDTIREEVETNDLLDEDFQEVTGPVRALEGIAQRAKGQTVDKVRTRIEWSDKLVRFPHVKGFESSGAVAKAVGITGRIRGTKIFGRRPDLAILDDPQTDESATSLTTNNKLERILSGAVLGLSGQKRRIACFCPCTVIAPGDMADRLLDQERNPDWQGERMKLLYQLPAREDLWDQYAKTRADGLRAGDGGAAATKLYAANREEMDRGAQVAWPERFDDGEISAIQHAMNLKLKDFASFMAEYQNTPVTPDDDSAAALDPADICDRATNVPRLVVPRDCTRLTAFIDVGAHLLWWVVVAWDERFGGSVVSYGVYPEQHLSYFSATQPRPGLGDLPGMKGQAQSVAVRAGLSAVAARALGVAYRQEETGQEMRVERCLVDANWGPGTDLVYDFCRRSQFAGIFLPSHGKFYGASARPLDQIALKPGEAGRDGWRVYPAAAGRGRHALYDTNRWKTFTAERLKTKVGEPGALTLHAAGPAGHLLLADHLAAEYPVAVELKGGGNCVNEWKARPGRDNHWFDCVVGCAVAASLAGLRWDSGAAAGEPPRERAVKKKVKLSDLYYAKHGGGR